VQDIGRDIQQGLCSMDSLDGLLTQVSLGIWKRSTDHHQAALAAVKKNVFHFRSNKGWPSLLVCILKNN